MESVTNKAVASVTGSAPWKASTPWWVTLVEGVILALMGVFLLVNPTGGGGLLLQLIALVLLVQSVIQIAGGLQAEPSRGGDWTMLQSGVGATVAALVVIDGWLHDYLTIDAARVILGIGLLAFALLGLAGAFLGGQQPESWVGPVVNALLLAVLALLLLTSHGDAGLTRLRLIAAVAIVGGALLVFLAFRNKNATA